MAAELKPCPFCGGEAEIISGASNRQVFFVTCDTCGAETPWIARTKAEAAEAWNRRATNEP